MSRAQRVLALLVLVEGGIAVLWWWLVDGLSTGKLNAAGGNAAETAATLSTILGGTMGLMAGAMLFTAFMVRRKAA